MEELLILLLSISSNLFVGLFLTPLQWLGRVMELVLFCEVWAEAVSECHFKVRASNCGCEIPLTPRASNSIPMPAAPSTWVWGSRWYKQKPLLIYNRHETYAGINLCSLKPLRFGACLLLYYNPTYINQWKNKQNQDLFLPILTAKSFLTQ